MTVRSEGWSATDLAPLGEEVRERLAAIASTAEYSPGDAILREGHVTPFLALVERGRVALRLSVPERGPQTVVTLEAGELLGWSALVPPYRTTAETVALEPTRLVTFDAARLRDLVSTDVVVASELLPIGLRSLYDRLSASWQQQLDLFGGRTGEPW